LKVEQSVADRGRHAPSGPIDKRHRCAPSS
jgi:hypothetical protein